MNIQREPVAHPDASLRVLAMALEAFRGQRHRHHHVELTWIEQGSGLRTVGDTVAPFVDGDLVLVGANVPHQWTSRRRGAPGSARATCVQFSPQWCLPTVMPEFAALAGLLRRAQRGLSVHGATQEQCVAHLRAMPEADALQRLAHLIAVLGLLARGADDLQPVATAAPRGTAPEPAPDRVAEVLPEPTPRDAPRRIDKVIDWVHRHLADEIDVAQAARVAHVSPGAFSRFFHREVGKPFSRYVNDARCSAACLRLVQTADPVARIALDCGFTTLSNFNAQFRARHGMTPREFRRRA